MSGFGASASSVGAARGRKAERRRQQKRLYEQREQQRDLQDRAQRQAIPGRDDGPPPRID